MIATARSSQDIQDAGLPVKDSRLLDILSRFFTLSLELMQARRTKLSYSSGEAYLGQITPATSSYPPNFCGGVSGFKTTAVDESALRLCVRAPAQIQTADWFEAFHQAQFSPTELNAIIKHVRASGHQDSRDTHGEQWIPFQLHKVCLMLGAKPSAPMSNFNNTEKAEYAQLVGVVAKLRKSTAQLTPERLFAAWENATTRRALSCGLLLTSAEIDALLANGADVSTAKRI